MTGFKKVLGVGAAFALAIALGGCAGHSEPKQAEQPAQKAPAAQVQKKADAPAAKKITLEKWAGEWNGFHKYLDKPEVQKAYEEAAKDKKSTPEAIKKELEERRKCEFNGLRIKGNTIEFLDGFAKDGAKTVTKATYECVDSKKVMHGGHQLEWDVFKAKEADAKYPVLLMMPVHGEEELVHFHMRYGTNADELLKKDKWFPTFVKPDSTLAQIEGEIKE